MTAGREVSPGRLERRYLRDGLQRVGCCVCFAERSSGGPGCGEFGFSRAVREPGRCLRRRLEWRSLDGLAETFVQGFRCAEESGCGGRVLQHAEGAADASQGRRRRWVPAALQSELQAFAKRRRASSNRQFVKRQHAEVAEALQISSLAPKSSRACQRCLERGACADIVTGADRTQSVVVHEPPAMGCPRRAHGRSPQPRRQVPGRRPRLPQPRRSAERMKRQRPS